MKMKVTGFDDVFKGLGEAQKELNAKTQDSPLNLKLVEIGNQIIADLRASLMQHTNSQSLVTSIGEGGNFIEIDGDNIAIVIRADYYWRFINSGVNGLQRSYSAPFSFKTPYPSKAMVDSLQRGIATKGLTLPMGFKTYNSYAWASARKIKRDGIEPNHFVDDVLTPEYIQRIQKTLADEFGKTVSLAIENSQQ